MPSRTIDTQTFEGKSIQCTKFVSSEEFSWKADKIVSAAADYEFQLVIKALAETTITIQIGDSVKTQPVGTSFTRFIIPFPDVTNNDNDSLYITFPAGTYWLYNLQLERATTPSEWRPAPEDAEDYANQAAQDAVDSQTQLEVFNKLTNNGQAQGVYILDGQLYINGEYIASKSISADKIYGENITADHLTSYKEGRSVILESESAYIDIRKLIDNVWHQRVGIYYTNADGGAIRLSTGDVDESGSPTGNPSQRTLMTPTRVSVGIDENGVPQGYIAVKEIRFPANAIMNGDVTMNDDLFLETGLRLGSVNDDGKTKIYIKKNGAYYGNDDFELLTIRGGDGRNYKVIARDNGKSSGMKSLATTPITAVNGTWSFNIAGLQGILVIYSVDSNSRQTITIPYGQMGLGFTWGSGGLTFTTSSTDDEATITLTSVPSGGSLRSCFGIY